MANHVTIKDLANELDMCRSNLRKYLIDNDFSMEKIRPPEGRGQLMLALTEQDAEAVRELRKKQGFSSSHSNPVVVSDNGLGYFYISQLVPDLDPLRIKVGFASNIEARLQAHRTAAPTAKLIKTWLCKRIWEQSAIDSITRIDCELIVNEVFDCSYLDGLVQRANEFFNIMPDLNKDT